MSAPGRVLAGGFRDVFPACPAQESHREVPERGHDPRAVSGADLGPVFVEGGIPDMMASIFDFPMTASESEERFRAGLSGRQAG